MKPTLLILAAGMGSRYGGIKQLDRIGPSGETIMDYSVYDALRAGFGKIIFIIRKSIEQQFKEVILEKYKNMIPCEYVFQEIDALPEGFALPEGRQKPWGTGHAILMAKNIIKEPFAVINADDFYGRDAFAQMGSFLKNADASSKNWSMVGYGLRNTLSDFGVVSRGVCQVDDHGMLKSVTERTKIQRVDEKIVYLDAENSVETLDENASVSMNFWGFTPPLFECLQTGFEDFLKNNENVLLGEYYIPSEVSNQIMKKQATVRVLPTLSKWFGVTYAAEKQSASDNIRALVDAGEYPEKLF